MRYNKKMWLVAYDLKTEQMKGLTEKQKLWLANQRYKIWLKLRFKYNCVPLQKSLWLLRDESLRDELAKKIEKWKAEYKAKGFDVLFEIFPIATTEVGYKTFKDFEFDFLMEWLASIERSLDKQKEKSKPSYRVLLNIKKKLELIEMILDEDFKDDKRYNEASDTIMILQDKLGELEWRK